MGEKKVLFLLICFILGLSLPLFGEESLSFHLAPQDLQLSLSTYDYLSTYRSPKLSLLVVEDINLKVKDVEFHSNIFFYNRDDNEQVFVFTDKGLALQNHFELMEGVALIGSYRMEGSSTANKEGVLFSRTASGEILIDPQLFLNMGISIQLIQEDRDRIEGSLYNERAQGAWDPFFSSYRDESIMPGDDPSFWEERYDVNQVQRTGIGLNIVPFDKTVVLADYILHKDINDLSTRITSLGLGYEDERNRLLAKYELEASEANRKATAMAGLEVGISPWGNLMATFQRANQQYLEEIMNESVLNLGLDIFLSDTTSLLLGYQFTHQNFRDLQEDINNQKEKSNVAGARLKFRF